MVPYKVSFVMQVGCRGMASGIREMIRGLLATKEMALGTLRSVQVVEMSEALANTPDHEAQFTDEERAQFTQFLDGLHTLLEKTGVTPGVCFECGELKLYLRDPDPEKAKLKLSYRPVDVDHLELVIEETAEVHGKLEPGQPA